MRSKKDSRTVAATVAAKGFGALMDRVRESRQVYQIESRGQVVAEIGPARRSFTVGNLRALLERGHRAPAELIDAIDAARADARAAHPASVVPLSGRGGRKRR